MVSNLFRHTSAQAARNTGDTVEALAEMLRQNGIDPSRIDALISKASYPPSAAPVIPNQGGKSGKGRPAPST